MPSVAIVLSKWHAAPSAVVTMCLGETVNSRSWLRNCQWIAPFNDTDAHSPEKLKTCKITKNIAFTALCFVRITTAMNVAVKKSYCSISGHITKRQWQQQIARTWQSVTKVRNKLWSFMVLKTHILWLWWRSTTAIIRSTWRLCTCHRRLHFAIGWKHLWYWSGNVIVIIGKNRVLPSGADPCKFVPNQGRKHSLIFRVCIPPVCAFQNLTSSIPNPAWERQPGGVTLLWKWQCRF